MNYEYITWYNLHAKYLVCWLHINRRDVKELRESPNLAKFAILDILITKDMRNIL